MWKQKGFYWNYRNVLEGKNKQKQSAARHSNVNIRTMTFEYIHTQHEIQDKRAQNNIQFDRLEKWIKNFYYCG